MARSNSSQVKTAGIAAMDKPQVLWVVVVVESGVPVLVEAHPDVKTAKGRERFFRKSMRKDYDEVGVFEVEVGSESSA